MLTDTLTSVAFAVDPVPWARSQMAFTLAFHIILVPLGVSWSVMTLIANYRGIKHDDRDALLLAQRWSKYMAVTFAVGAVTGTVLSFQSVDGAHLVRIQVVQAGHRVAAAPRQPRILRRHHAELPCNRSPRPPGCPSR